MLVLSRKPGQSIQIADDVTVSVLSSTGNRVLLGIAAPSDKRIIRAEVIATDGDSPNHSATTLKPGAIA